MSSVAITCENLCKVFDFDSPIPEEKLLNLVDVLAFQAINS